MKRRVLAVLAVTVLAVSLTVHAEPPRPAGANAPTADKSQEATPETLTRLTDRAAAEYKKFEDALLRLVHRLERSPRVEDKEKAAALRKAIVIANNEQVENRFQKLVATLIGNKDLTTGDLEKVAGENDELIKVLRDMLNILLTDSDLLKKQEEIKKLTELIKQINQIITAEKIEQSKMDGNRVASATIAKAQQGITKATESVARSLGGKKPDEKKDGKEGDAKNADANPKAGEPKDDTKDPKATPKDPKAGDPKGGDPKAGDPKAGDPKAGDSKAGDPKGGDPKAGDPKPNEPKPNDPKAQDKKNSSDSKNKPDNKSDSKGSSGDPKSGDPKDQKGQSGQSKPSQAQQSQQSSQSKPNQNQQASQSQPPQSPPSPQDQKAQKQIQEAINGQKKVEDELDKNKREDASKSTDKVIDDLTKLKEELEKRLKQLREEELERLLANLQARCERMLAMQIDVQSGTKRVYSVVVSLENKKPTRAEEQQSQQLSTREGEIVKEANRTLQLLGAEGSAVAFAMSLENVRDDMSMIEKRLDKYDVAEFTQKMEQDVIDALKEMIEALKKKQQEMKDQKNNPKPPSNSPPPPQRLLDLLAELRLIKSQQLQVNKRTIDYAQHYQGEQTDDPLLQKELELLAKRQAKLEDMLKKIATGKNQ